MFVHHTQAAYRAMKKPGNLSSTRNREAHDRTALDAFALVGEWTQQLNETHTDYHASVVEAETCLNHVRPIAHFVGIPTDARLRPIRRAVRKHVQSSIY